MPRRPYAEDRLVDSLAALFRASQDHLQRFEHQLCRTRRPLSNHEDMVLDVCGADRLELPAVEECKVLQGIATARERRGSDTLGIALDPRVEELGERLRLRGIDRAERDTTVDLVALQLGVTSELERRMIQTDGSRERYVAVRAAGPLTREPLDIETLKLEADALRDEVNELRTDLEDKLGDMKRAAATAALILGVFPAFRPEKATTLGSILFAVAAMPFLVVLYVSLWGGDPIEEELEARTYPGRTMFSNFSAVQRIVQKWEQSPLTEIMEQEFSVASYEQIDRRNRAEKEMNGPERGHVLLRHEDALLARIDRLSQIRTNIAVVDVAARRKLRLATAWLGVLALYLLIAAVVTSFAS
jgi:hypothetical protein